MVAADETTEDAMDVEFEQWQWLVGSWAIEAAHPALPGDDIRGRATFEWLDDQKFLIQRSHFDHPKIPDAVSVTGIVDGKPTTHYFDPRGVHREFEVAITADSWRSWNDTPGFAQRFTGTRDGDVITGVGELSRDGVTWDLDISITYRRID
jgi:hypothetical protein